MSHHPTINKKCLLINGQNNRKTKPSMKADQSFSATIQISLMNLLLKNYRISKNRKPLKTFLALGSSSSIILKPVL